MHEIYRTGYFSVNNDTPMVIEFEQNFWFTELFITVYKYVLTYYRAEGARNFAIL